MKKNLPKYSTMIVIFLTTSQLLLAQENPQPKPFEKKSTPADYLLFKPEPVSSSFKLYLFATEALPSGIHLASKLKGDEPGLTYENVNGEFITRGPIGLGMTSEQAHQWIAALPDPVILEDVEQFEQNFRKAVVPEQFAASGLAGRTILEAVKVATAESRKTFKEGRALGEARKLPLTDSIAGKYLLTKKEEPSEKITVERNVLKDPLDHRSGCFRDRITIESDSILGWIGLPGRSRLVLGPDPDLPFKRHQ